MPLRPPLPLDELKAIQERHKDNVDVMALLWEVRRLQIIALHADQLARSLPQMTPIIQAMADGLKYRLADDPTVLADRANRAEMLNPHAGPVNPADED